MSVLPGSARVAGRGAGVRIGSVADLRAWLRVAGREPDSGCFVAATFVIEEGGGLRIADRRSEHVACASGGPVLSAGEVFFRVEGDKVEVAEVSNQSTGYCPEPESWPSVAAALDQV